MTALTAGTATYDEIILASLFPEHDAPPQVQVRGPRRGATNANSHSSSSRSQPHTIKSVLVLFKDPPCLFPEHDASPHDRVRGPRHGDVLPRELP